MPKHFHTTAIQTIRQVDVYYEHYPNPKANETMILLHGFLSSSFSFRRLIPLLVRDYHVICIDLPPFGKSGKSDTFIYSYDNLAQTIIEFIEIRKFTNVTIIGHSMGGQIALNIAYKRPDLVDNIILLCSSGYMQRVKKPLILLSYLPFFHLYVKLHLARSGISNNLKTVIYDHTLIDQEMIDGYEAPFQEKTIFRALTRMIRDREGDLSTEQLAKITTPCLLIWGEEDKVVPLQTGKRLAKELKHSQLFVIKEAGHLLPEECPEIVNDYIKNFLHKLN